MGSKGVNDVKGNLNNGKQRKSVRIWQINELCIAQI